MYQFLIVRPLRMLYQYGPSSIGCWDGLSETSICSRMTSSDESFWLKNLEQCTQLIDTKFKSVLICFETLVYFWFLYRIFIFMFVNSKRCLKNDRTDTRIVYVVDPHMVDTSLKTNEKSSGRSYRL